eukprot:TRINITY_DN4122_c0_g1_i1.p1 TRINITY_DN4122_c0_g1~~TRINITY_DN4122_c0_g1_i1.p1  ORF type:complete len:709 (-),score=201.19 TRINITY_DN4122_c0_g1_i1:79-2205(-)
MFGFQRALQMGLSPMRATATRSIHSRSISGVQQQKPLIEKIVIANRGEIACRVIRSAREMGVKTVAVYSDIDADSMHVSEADEAYNIGAASASESYLRGDKILEVAKRSGAGAIHPGYGFLSENARFAKACETEGIVFIGPPASAIEAMGSKSASKNIMEAAGVKCVPGYHGEDQAMETLKSEAEKMGYPVLIKAVLGGGGKGMRIVETAAGLEEGVLSSKREAISSFGDDRVLIEKYIPRPRHIEIQVFADSHGNCVYLFERDCSVQRRHQKVLEEAPGPGVSDAWRKEMGEAAVAAAQAVGYVGAGTVEFIVDDDDDSFYFMEMNTRLQVEHPVTEMITKQDLVEWQLQVASGNTLPVLQKDLKIHGHAIEARIYAENPDSNFLPGTGTLNYLSTPTESENVRVDTGVRQGDEVSVYYDPMIAKLIVWDNDRNSALRRMGNALEDYKIVGLSTNVSFLHRAVTHDKFKAGPVTTAFIDTYKKDLFPATVPAPDNALVMASLAQVLKEQDRTLSENMDSYDSSSPWGEPDAARVNHNHTRTFSYGDGDVDRKVAVEYLGDANFSMQVDGGEARNVSGELTEHGDITCVIGDRRFTDATIVEDGDAVHVFDGSVVHKLSVPTFDFESSAVEKGSLLSPMPGKIVQVLVSENQAVKKGDPLLILEAMKMEHTIRAPEDGFVTNVQYMVNDLVEENKTLVTIKGNDEKSE